VRRVGGTSVGKDALGMLGNGVAREWPAWRLSLVPVVQEGRGVRALASLQRRRPSVGRPGTVTEGPTGALVIAGTSEVVLANKNLCTDPIGGSA
jgi:hypothetical protein